MLVGLTCLGSWVHRRCSTKPELSRGVKSLLILVACAVGFVICEIAYRSYLYVAEPYHFQGDDNLWYFQTSPYRFNAEFGFEYVPGSYVGGAAYEGRVIACWDRMEEWEINGRGNSGRIKGSYEDAEFKILAFGDSFTQRARLAPNGDYMTWPNYLQDMLEGETGTSVHVVNFGRDAYGVLQMFDLASAKIAEWRPDLAVIAFITNDLTRDRFWRTTTILDGRERIMTSIVPVQNPDWDVATDAYLLQSDATSEWCHHALDSGAVDDPIVLELEEALRAGRRRSTLLADPFSLSQSFALDRIIHRDPYYSTYNSARPSQLPRHELTDFEDDDRVTSAVNRLSELDIPYVLVHLATFPELSNGEEYGRSGEREVLLLESLARLTGKPIMETLAHVTSPIAQLTEIPNSDSDDHPSLTGHQFYAETILGILRGHGYLEVR